ncbi:MAG: DUF349 domain-containing protein [Cytophagales bacterium]|nr:MAG: DUF349 domain-containing protein [Cytophagales bacterium]TAF61871.1 MAG: DUF349 domain-containing protein [Cytophagales bacterium]
MSESQTKPITNTAMNHSAYGYVKDGNVYLKGYMNYPDRIVGVVKESEEASMAYFVARYERVLQKVEELKQNVNSAQNKGSYLMKLLHLRNYLQDYNGVGNFPYLLEQLEDMENDIKGYVSVNRVKNYQTKVALLEEARQLRESVEWQETADKFKELKMKWIRTGSAEKGHEEEMCAEFDKILDHFFAARKEFFDAAKKLETDRLNLYRRYIDEVTIYIRQRNQTPEARERVMVLQKEWKNVGQIDRWKYLKLWKKYKKLIDTFFGNSHAKKMFPSGSYSQQRVYLKPTGNSDMPFQRIRPEFKPKPMVPDIPLTEPEVLARKKEVCLKVEDIIAKDAPIVLENIKTLQAEWKKFGRINNNEEDKEYNNRFRAACNEIFELHYLLESSRAKHEGYDEKTRFEQLKIKIKLLKEDIKTDETNLQNMVRLNPSLAAAAAPKTGNEEADKERLEYMNTLNRIKTKKRILKRMQNNLVNNQY